MTELERTLAALGLGVVQGVTEFLPVSSDGHLALYALLLPGQESSLALTVLLHVGTLLATLLVFRRELLQLARATLGGFAQPRAFARSEHGQLLWALFVACVPTAVIGLSFESSVETYSRNPSIVGAGFLASAIAVASTRTRSGGVAQSPTTLAALLIGTVQGLAVLPGLSRSAVTIACALWAGSSAPSAFRFSFLLSIPAVAGAALLELGDPGVLGSMNGNAWAGALAAFATGYLALRILQGVLSRGQFWLFAWYLVPLGTAMMVFGLSAR